MNETDAKKSRSILMLGGSRQQVVAIEKAKELGYRTVLCDYLPDNPGQHHADVFYQESTTDRGTMLAVARKENVSGVLAYSSDPASPTAGYVAEQLGLPTNPLKVIETMSEKHLFRAFMRQSGLPCPQAASFPANATPQQVAGRLAGFRWPVIVKPTDSSGSKGVTVLQSSDGLPRAIRHAADNSRNRTLIAEEYIAKGFPYVIGGDVFVWDGQVRFWGLMSCLRDASGTGLVPVGEKLPAGLTAAQTQAVKYVLQSMVFKLGVRFGELNVEVILAQDGTPYVIELGSRAGGNMIPVQLSDASGKDLVAANVQAAMGQEPADIDWDSSQSDKSMATYVLHSNVPGTFQGIRYDDEIRPHVYRQVIYDEPGDKVEAFDGANKALGIVFLRFDDETQMNGLLDHIRDHIRPIVTPQEAGR